MALIRHRVTARVLLQAETGRFLLFLTHWSQGSGLEPRWVTPGGGVESEEPFANAASRELAEETGLLIAPQNLGEPLKTLNFVQNWTNGDHETGEAIFFHHRISEEFEPSRNAWTPEEHQDILMHGWWDAGKLIADGESVGPPGLVDLMVGLA